MQTPPCPLSEAVPTAGQYRPLDPVALARQEGAREMLTALQQAGVRIGGRVYLDVCHPLLLAHRDAWMGTDTPVNEARLIADRTGEDFNCGSL
jgi:hypothetical protein